MSSLSIAKSRNLESTAPKKGSAKSNTSSRRKVPSTAAIAKKPSRSVDSKAERVAAAKTPAKIDQPQVARVTKQERVLDVFRFLDELVQNGLAPIGLQRDAICGVPSRGGLDLTDLVNDPAALDGAARCDTHSLSLNSADRCFRKCF